MQSCACGRNVLVVLAVGFALSAGSVARAQVTIPGADGSDGAFNPTSNITVDLADAPTGVWNGANPNPGQGKGVYDPDKWAVVFRYSSVNVPAGVTVNFRNHDWRGIPGNPPVVWLVNGAVTINGGVSLTSLNVTDSLGFLPGGPGGFRVNGYNCAGLGPGGGDSCGNYGTFGYSNSRLLPLIGGPGGSYYVGSHLQLFAGGGAILIATSGTLLLNGYVDSIAPIQWGGTGGAVRLVCNDLEGAGSVDAYGGGRIRFEANHIAFASPGNPVASFGLPGTTAQIWPDDAIVPSIRVLSVGSATVPADPLASFEFP